MENKNIVDKTEVIVSNETKVSIPKREIIEALKMLAAAKRKLEALMK